MGRYKGIGKDTQQRCTGGTKGYVRRQICMKRPLNEEEVKWIGRTKRTYLEFLRMSVLNTLGRKDPWVEHCGRADGRIQN